MRVQKSDRDCSATCLKLSSNFEIRRVTCHLNQIKGDTYVTASL